MNNTERTLAILNYQNYDRLPLVHFGYWWETLEKWAAEGHLQKDENGNFKSGWPEFDFGWGDCGWGGGSNPIYGLLPAFERKVLKTLPDGSKHVQDDVGATVLEAPDATSIPAEIDHLLKDRATWEEHYKPRLQWFEARLSRPKWADDPHAFDRPRGLYCGSMIGLLRNMMGVVGLSYLTVDDEELLDEMLQTFADIALQNVKTALSWNVKFAYGHFWEDICFKNGPLISPALFEEKIAPLYKPITDELARHGVNIVSLDCDGFIDHLIPGWLENGVNTMFPIEVGTWNASIKPWRESYGKELRGVGGMNKNVFAEDRAAVDAEIERLKPLVALGGFIPCPDHLIPPTAKWDLVCYYCDKMRATF